MFCIAMLTIAGFAVMQISELSGQTTGSLQDRFRESTAGATKATAVIGRVALVLVKPGSAEYVRADTSLRPEEKFRIAVSSNIGGWLYMFQRSQDGGFLQLWPRPAGAGEATVGQKIEARRTYLIPDAGVFVFHPEEASERLFVDINTQPALPNLEKQSKEQPVSNNPVASSRAAGAAGARITNYLIKDPFGGPARGLTFDPGPVDAEPYIYFSSAPGVPPTHAMVEIQLKKRTP
jgi:hypothetical protein